MKDERERETKNGKREERESVEGHVRMGSRVWRLRGVRRGVYVTIRGIQYSTHRQKEQYYSAERQQRGIAVYSIRGIRYTHWLILFSLLSLWMVFSVRPRRHSGIVDIKRHVPGRGYIPVIYLFFSSELLVVSVTV